MSRCEGEASELDELFENVVLECELAEEETRLSYTVRNELERLTREQRKEIVSRVIEGCAPLFVACKKGSANIVEYFISMCGADPNQRGVYKMTDSRSMHTVTPLWCAAVAGKLAVVKQLIKHGANVNSVSDTGSTPVRSACFMSHLEVVMYLVDHGADIAIPNYNGGTCLINSVQNVRLCRFLLHRGADVNAQDVQKNTALHYAIQKHRLDATRLLLQQHANPFLRNRYGDDLLQTACLNGDVEIYTHLVSTFEYSDARRAEANELMGTTFLDKEHDVQSALFYWRRAQTLRERESVPKPLGERRPAFQMAEEYVTAEQLDALADDPDALYTQSLLMCERILGPQHKETMSRIIYRGAVCAYNMQYQRCVDLWQYTLQLYVAKDTLLHNEAGQLIAALAILYLVKLDKGQVGLLHDRLRLEDVLAMATLLVDWCGKSARLLTERPIYQPHINNFDKLLHVLTHLLHVLNALPKHDAAEEAAVRHLVCCALAQQPRTASGDSLLHLVVSRQNTIKVTFFEEAHARVFPDASLAALLLECGADVEAINEARSTALHVAALRNNFDPEVVQTLLHYGAHLDRRNANGNQPHHMLAGISECMINPLEHINLQCLAARKIVEHRIPFTGEVPSALENFIRIH
ncbi:hypothetical protein HPB51_001860 [Rhipicephalus microplus]|uniref:Uncharacterized protein n=1 Tax=Rhipicephalus microplus TaxID=6941 RepID=A0A9J6D8E7_RHIMP|nr:protein fem-1 homolog A-like [Rhipicephalus microplus]KAH8018304.1 hypothetical protein HPB51_001860 [Rhipicephalus microplus]